MPTRERVNTVNLRKPLTVEVPSVGELLVTPQGQSSWIAGSADGGKLTVVVHINGKNTVREMEAEGLRGWTTKKGRTI